MPCPGTPRGRLRAPRRWSCRCSAGRRRATARAGWSSRGSPARRPAGCPAFTSSMCAPASTWATASRSTRLKSPSRISCGEQLAAGGVDALADDRERPVEADDVLAGRRADDGAGHAGCGSSSWGWRARRDLGVGARVLPAAVGDELGEDLARVLGLEARRQRVHLGLEVGAARPALATPTRRCSRWRPSCRPASRRGRWRPGTADAGHAWPRPAVLRGDLGGDVAPADRPSASGASVGRVTPSSVDRLSAHQRRRPAPGGSIGSVAIRHGVPAHGTHAGTASVRIDGAASSP